jgi:D-serine deaminase-like pyridoxal phosphate-dependent protein
MNKKSIYDLISPAILVDIDRVENNISEMVARAKEGGVSLRPHIKTHKCIEIGKMQLDAGAQGITVSTLAEAQAFADEGFDDITYAVPLSPDKFPGVQKVSERTHLNVLVDHPIIVDRLGDFCKRNKFSLDVLVKVNCGYPRTGIDSRTPAAISLVKKIHKTPNLRFKGILTHAGHSYDKTTLTEIKTVARQEQEVMIQFADTLKAESEALKPEVVSIGSTPTVRLADSFQEGITEIRPGNYVFFDYTQVALGSCDLSDCALTVLSSVISVNPDRVVIDAGATALSKDTGPTHIESNVGYGKLFKNYQKSQLNVNVILKALSQEHGKIIPVGGADIEYKHGDRVRILPNHSCLTANLFDQYHIVKGETVVNRWKVHRERFE